MSLRDPRRPPGKAPQRKRLLKQMTRDGAKKELERIATEAPYERDRIQAIRLLREIWAEEEVDPQTRAGRAVRPDGETRRQ